MQNMPDGADIDFELELLDFDKQPNWHDAGPDEKIRRAQTLKEQGERCFQTGRCAVLQSTQQMDEGAQDAGQCL